MQMSVNMQDEQPAFSGMFSRCVRSKGRAIWLSGGGAFWYSGGGLRFFFATSFFSLSIFVQVHTRSYSFCTNFLNTPF